MSAYTFAIEIFRISLKFLFALVNAVERGQANVTSYFSPLRYLIDIPCSTGHLSGLHSWRCSKTVALFLRVLWKWEVNQCLMLQHAVIEMKNPQTHAALGIYHEINIALLTVQHLLSQWINVLYELLAHWWEILVEPPLYIRCSFHCQFQWVYCPVGETWVGMLPFGPQLPHKNGCSTCIKQAMSRPNLVSLPNTSFDHGKAFVCVSKFALVYIIYHFAMCCD